MVLCVFRRAKYRCTYGKGEKKREGERNREREGKRERKKKTEWEGDKKRWGK